MYLQLAGLALISVGMIVIVQADHYSYLFGGNENTLATAAGIVIGTGCFIFLVGFCACCGAIKEVICLLQAVRSNDSFIDRWMYGWTKSHCTENKKKKPKFVNWHLTDVFLRGSLGALHLSFTPIRLFIHSYSFIDTLFRFDNYCLSRILERTQVYSATFLV